MRILFLYPNEIMTTRMPVGIGYLASYLKKEGHRVKVFDTTFMKCSRETINDEELRASSLQVRNPPDFEKYGLVEEDGDVGIKLQQEIETFKPDLLGVNLVDPNYNFALNLLRRVKKQNPGLSIIAGGPTVTFSPEEVAAEECVDILCIGEGEEAMCELCNTMEQGEDYTQIKNLWVKKNGRIHKNEVRPLCDPNDILLPDWDIFDLRHLWRPLDGKMYRMGFLSMTRGCPFRCTYCSNFVLEKIYKNKGSLYRMKSVDFFIKEAKLYTKKYNLDFVMFLDDLFPLHNRNIMDDFCHLYKEHIGLPFTINLRPEFVTEDLFAMIVGAGCRNVCVGLESGNPRIRKDVLGRVYKNEQVVRVFEWVRKYKIRGSTFNMIGLPYETRRNVFETIELNRKANPHATTVTFAHPYRGTGLRDLCIKEKFFDPSKEKKHENIFRAKSNLNLPTISNNEVEGLFKVFQLYFRLPKVFYGFIRIAEGNSPVANFTYNILKKIYYRITDKKRVG